jgi:hypothetical protein
METSYNFVKRKLEETFKEFYDAFAIAAISDRVVVTYNLKGGGKRHSIQAGNGDFEPFNVENKKKEGKGWAENISKIESISITEDGKDVELTKIYPKDNS